MEPNNIGFKSEEDRKGGDRNIFNVAGQVKY